MATGNGNVTLTGRDTCAPGAPKALALGDPDLVETAEALLAGRSRRAC